MVKSYGAINDFGDSLDLFLRTSATVDCLVLCSWGTHPWSSRRGGGVLGPGVGSQEQTGVRGEE